MNPQTGCQELSEVCIALGTYNGSAFIEQQVQSIFSQQHHRCNIIARDDGSEDKSIDILLSLSEEQQFSVIRENHQNQGVLKNFNSILNETAKTSCKYIALADQDDVWYKNKIENQITLMKQLEEKYPQTPILIHSDLEVVNESLKPIASSFMRYQGIRHEPVNPLDVLLVQNYVTGCTVLVNRPLLDLALPIPSEALMHDWWLALCAASFGKIAYIDKPLLKYRQHGKNEVGAKPLLRMLNPFKNNYCQNFVRGRQKLSDSMSQASALAERIKQIDSSNSNLPLIEAYAQLRKDSPIKRVRKIRSLKIHSQSRLRHIVMLLRLMSMSSQ
ncbi:UDP-Glc:alpha-D-GlcNAc-diphosphoundecaprenol beta-1,3-glucosyltransferase WfgD [Gimesia maris]|uniref:glycosyltransferase family 2 protein n=1 Tax=Gimesia maris TaxID=122 RepID=UPI001188A7A0|nr:glycosyltransferase family 2 protein [Gimesia maris]QDT80992.1 UDP-Glc:alpha-D-GlcNAc-diphosphoundecaprenol beta-1,3-glucosyltransferase WfgD [Gimesia maris]